MPLLYVKTVLLYLHQDLIKQETLIKSYKTSTIMLFNEKEDANVSTHGIIIQHNEKPSCCSSEERSLQEVCSQYNVDETACKSYVQHLEFLDAKAKKRVTERNTLQLISWTIEKIVKALTNKQLKMYLKKKRF